MTTFTRFVAAVAVAALPTFAPAAEREKPATAPAVTRVPVVFAGGHDTDPRDHGRPVALVAAGLGVPADVFREAFTKVHPAGPGQQPEPEQVRQNKAALMAALGKYGVTNETLDAVSNYYRYPPGRGNLWRVRPAAAVALVRDGAVVGYEVTDGGAGYTTPPTVTVPDVKNAPAVAVELAFGKDLKTNGSIATVTVLRAKEAKEVKDTKDGAKQPRS
jgi:hypothetical protein